MNASPTRATLPFFFPRALIGCGRIALHGCLLLVLTACKVSPPAADVATRPGDQPAVIVQPTAASHAELEQVVSDMLFGAQVTLPRDALTDSSVLVVERERIESLGQPPILGRDLGRPERFRLFRSGAGCVLIHESNGARYQLPKTDCAPEN